ncbi:polyhydroxyalkanoate granule-associated phasin [Aromatoleum diolicum]|uniref:Phasin domain-containing protein n=1 Tax=Aromatoleum diolicum TaxID=75796 RepID=A0ABX1Q7V0_9RHOO|nr:polyhydroxyalkanoate granule-associated phasin [Aromatoleum diolicum]NMG74449.1 hypothetical protein [Aromatoleum diolicum]
MPGEQLGGAVPHGGFVSSQAGIAPATVRSGKVRGSASNDATESADAARPAAPYMTQARTQTRGAMRNPFANPFLIWTELAMKTGEMMLASAQVIGHRTERIAAAGTMPNAHDLHEFNLMGQEKIDAAVESSRAMTMQMMKLNQQLWARTVRQMQAGVVAMMSLAASRSVAESIARQATLVRTMTRSADTASQLSRAVARVARSGLNPIHARATANAERLARREGVAGTNSD